jgi:hypothetical protein
MRLFLYKRIGNYHEETYSIVAENNEEAQRFIDSYNDFEISNEQLRNMEINEVDFTKKGIEYVNSYYA